MASIGQTIRCVAVALLLIAATGCGESVYKVSGAVTFEGKPMVGGGSISFVPLGEGKQRAAGGTIAENGTYTLTTLKDGDGAMAGEYRVVIFQVTETEPKNTGDDGKVRIPAKSLPMADRIPTTFADTYNSPLTAKVEAKAVNEINFHLKRE